VTPPGQALFKLPSALGIEQVSPPLLVTTSLAEEGTLSPNDTLLILERSLPDESLEAELVMT
jgi:hypothetical protein